MKIKAFTPSIGTPLELYSKAETTKLQEGLVGDLPEEFRNAQPDLTKAAESIAKSHGIYLEFNRAGSPGAKKWIYMIRINIPGGGPLSARQWLALDEAARRYAVRSDGFPSLRLTTRQSVQFHWVRKEGVIPLLQSLAKAGLFSLNACGDNVRGVMACPLPREGAPFNPREWAGKIGSFFRLPEKAYVQIFEIDPSGWKDESPGERFQYGPALLNRKFKFGVGGILPNPNGEGWINDNCVEVLTQDLGLVPVLQKDCFVGFDLYAGGGMGENFGRPTATRFGEPLAFVSPDRVLEVLEAVVLVQQEWGDRAHRHWARLKYLVAAKGMDWLQRRVVEILGKPLEPFRGQFPGHRHLHHGLVRNPHGNDHSIGLFIESGRLIDNSPNGRLLSLTKAIALEVGASFRATPNQDLLITGWKERDKSSIVDLLEEYGYGLRNGRPYSALRVQSGSCVGRSTCRLAYTDSEDYEPELLDELERRGWGHLSESIGVTGCERQCFRPATKSIGLVGSGKDSYQLKLFGNRHGTALGQPLTSEGRQYLRQVPKERVPDLLEHLFRIHESESQEQEHLGITLERLGPETILQSIRRGAAPGGSLGSPLARPLARRAGISSPP